MDGYLQRTLKSLRDQRDAGTLTPEEYRKACMAAVAAGPPEGAEDAAPAPPAAPVPPAPTTAELGGGGVSVGAAAEQGGPAVAHKAFAMPSFSLDAAPAGPAGAPGGAPKAIDVTAALPASPPAARPTAAAPAHKPAAPAPAPRPSSLPPGPAPPKPPLSPQKPPAAKPDMKQVLGGVINLDDRPAPAPKPQAAAPPPPPKPQPAPPLGLGGASLSPKPKPVQRAAPPAPAATTLAAAPTPAFAPGPAFAPPMPAGSGGITFNLPTGPNDPLLARLRSSQGVMSTPDPMPSAAAAAPETHALLMGDAPPDAPALEQKIASVIGFRKLDRTAYSNIGVVVVIAGLITSMFVMLGKDAPV